MTLLVAMVAQASAANPCARAEALYKAGYYADAEQEYKSLLGIQRCATTPLVKQARDAAERQAGTGKEPKELLEQAQRLQSAGFEEEARKLVKEVAQRSTEPIPAELRAVNRRVGWWREFLGFAGPLLRLALEMLVVFVGVIVAVLLLITGLHALWLRVRPSAQLSGFTGSSEETLAPVLSAALSATLTRMTDQAPGRRVDWQGGTEPKFEIPTAVTEAVPQAGLLAGLIQMLDKLLYRRLFIVTGTVHPVHEHRGAGLTLAIATRNGRPVEQVTIWEQQFMLKEAGTDTTDAVRYERLILPAAVWLGYRKKLGFDPAKPPLHAGDWLSYALFALGEIVPDPLKERRLYEQALDRDPCNLGARLNLAALLLQRPAYEVPPQSGGQAVEYGSREGWEECLEAANAHLGVVATLADPERDPIWYRAGYMQAIVCIYRQQGADAGTILCQLGQEMSIHDQKAPLHDLLDELRQAVTVLETTAKLMEGHRVDIPREPAGGWRSATAEYNLACFWSRYASAAPDEDERKRRTIEAVRRLRHAIYRKENAILEARVDPAFDPIRDDGGFEAIVKERHPPAESEKPVQYAVTLDPGPELLALARVPSPLRVDS